MVDWSDGIYGKKGENVFYKYFDFADIDHLTTVNQVEYTSIYSKVWKNIGICSDLYDYYSFGNPKRKISKRLLPAKGRLNNLNGYFHFRGKEYKRFEYTSIRLLIRSLFSKRDLCFGGNLKTSLMEDVVIFADFTPKFYAQNLLKHLILREELQSTIDSFISKFKLEQSVGVHIRNTDRKNDKSLQRVFKKISQYKLEKASFFLATDDNAIIDSFQRKYKTVFVFPKFIPSVESSGGGIHHWASSTRNDEYAEQVFKESIIDLWLLSKCKYLLYMVNSSFSQIAKTLHSSKCINWLEP